MAGSLVILATSLAVFFLIQRGSAETLIWQDEFDTLDLNQWSHLVTAWGGGNKEFQYYRNDRRNSYVRDGILYLRPTWTSADHGDDFLYSGSLSYPDCNMEPCVSKSGEDIVEPIQSARISSSFSFKYGRVEVRAKMPRGDWIWPAIWLLPKNWEYGDWPRSGEIDMIEVRANDNYNVNGVNQGCDRMISTMHWGPDAAHNSYWRSRWEKSIADSGRDFADDFHLFGMTWTDNHMIFTLDNEQFGDIWAPQGGFWYYGGFDQNPGGENIWKNGNWMAPFDREFNFILNVAVGGVFFPDGWGNRPWNWNDGHPMRDFWERRSEWLPTWHEEDAAMKIDYIRVYSVD